MTSLDRGGSKPIGRFRRMNGRAARRIGRFASVLFGALLVSSLAPAEDGPSGNSDPSRAALPAAVPSSNPEPEPAPFEPAPMPSQRAQMPVNTEVPRVYWIAREPPPEVLPYNPGQPIPAGYELQNHIGTGYVISGSIVGGIGYLLSAAAALSDAETDFEHRWLLLPILGPFIGMATLHDTCERDNPQQCGKSGATIEALAILGSMQIVGGALFTYGEFSRNPRLVLKQGYGLRVMPASIGQSGYGVAALGTW